MTKNRRSQSAAVRFGPALKALLLCALLGGSGIGYVWQKNQIHELGLQIKKNELQLEELKRQNKLGADQLAWLRSPRVLDARVKELNLGLGQPQPQQILRLVEAPSPAPPAPPNTAGRQLAARLAGEKQFP